MDGTAGMRSRKISSKTPGISKFWAFCTLVSVLVRLPSFRRGPSYLALVGFFAGARRAGLLLVGVGVPLEALCFQPHLICLQRRFPCASSIPPGFWHNRSAPSLPPVAPISLAFVNSDAHGQASDWIFI